MKVYIGLKVKFKKHLQFNEPYNKLILKAIEINYKLNRIYWDSGGWDYIDTLQKYYVEISDIFKTLKQRYSL